MCCHGNHAFLILLQDLKLTKHWFSSFQDVILAEGMNGICATLRPPMTIFLMAGASTKCTCRIKPKTEIIFHDSESRRRIKICLTLCQ